MSRLKKKRAVSRLIKALFGTKSANKTFLLHKDQYYHHYYFDKPICLGVDHVAKLELCSKKDSASLRSDLLLF